MIEKPPGRIPQFPTATDLAAIEIGSASSSWRTNVTGLRVSLLIAAAA